MRTIGDQLAEKVNSMSKLERCRLEHSLRGTRSEYLQGHEEAVEKAKMWIKELGNFSQTGSILFPEISTRFETIEDMVNDFVRFVNS